MVNATVQPEFEAEVENIKSEIEISGWENVFENELNEVGLIHPTGKGSSARDFPETNRKFHYVTGSLAVPGSPKILGQIQIIVS